MAVERFWVERGASASLDGGFLVDPRQSWGNGYRLNEMAKTLAELNGLGCIVLLGEPGAGKTTAVREACQAAGATYLDLGGYGTEDRIVREVIRGSVIENWRSEASVDCLYLDGFDEARTKVPHLSSLFETAIGEWDCSALRLRIACR